MPVLGFVHKFGGILAKKYFTLPNLCRTPLRIEGRITDLKKNLKNGRFGAVQVWEVTPEKPQPWGQEHTQGKV